MVIEHLGQMGFGHALHPMLQRGEYCSTVHCPQMGHTALHYAADKRHSEIVKLLLTAGAATDISDKV